jgi:hypothetical protein
LHVDRDLDRATVFLDSLIVCFHVV